LEEVLFVLLMAMMGGVDRVMTILFDSIHPIHAITSGFRNGAIELINRGDSTRIEMLLAIPRWSSCDKVELFETMELS
jgi:hypothetical protein